MSSIYYEDNLNRLFLVKMSTQLARKSITDFTPPTVANYESPQIDLFQFFICNTEEQREKLSNAIPVWDCLPRYSMSRKYAAKLQNQGIFPQLLNINFRYFKQDISIEIQPARIRDKSGNIVEYYPGGPEEVLEEVLRKIASIQNQGFFESTKDGCRSGVSFTIYQLRNELKNIGHSRSHSEIVLSLKILSRSLIEIKTNDKKNHAYHASPYFRSLSCVSKSDIEEDPKAQWHIEFHHLITKAIDTVEYRQFNFELMMSHSTQLARWIYKYLIIKYTFAHITDTFEIRYSTIKRDSALLESYSRVRKSVEAVKNALTELVNRGVLTKFTELKVTDSNRNIANVSYTLFPTIGFVTDIKAASKQKNVIIAQKNPIKATTHEGLRGVSSPTHGGLRGALLEV